MPKPHKPDVRIDELVKRIHSDWLSPEGNGYQPYRERDLDVIRFAVERAVGNKAYAHPTQEVPEVKPRKGKRAA